MITRGIIITSQFGSHTDGKSMWIKGGIHATQLRQHLLYFDKIDWPRNNIIAFGDEDEEIELLQKENILNRTQINLASFSTENYGADKLKSAIQIVTFLQRNKSENEEWAIAQPTQRIILPDDLSIEQKTVEISLYKCLPTPKADTKIEEILEFKEKRSDELKKLRGALDELYLGIIASKDIPRSKNKAIQEIEQNLSDIEKVMKEKGIKHFLSSFDINLNLKDLAIGGMAGFGTGINFGMPAIGTAFGALFSSINFKVDLLKKPKNIPPKIKAYAYLHDVKKHL